MNEVDFTHDGKVAKLAAGQVQSMRYIGKRKATGDIAFADNPTADDTVTINGVEFTFKAEATSAYEVEIDESLSDTLDNLVAALNDFESDLEDEAQAAADTAAVAKATYAKGGTNDKLVITYGEFGSVGNSFTIDASDDTPSGETLEGGVDGDVINLDAQTMALVTLEGGAMDFDLPVGKEGQEVCVYLHTKGTGANAVVNGAFASGTKITFDTAGKFAALKYLGSSWKVISNTGTLS